MKGVREAVVDIMEKTTVADLCEQARTLAQEPSAALDFSI
jgi:hypothetical protein